MNDELEARIRRHVEQLDGTAPPVEQLAPRTDPQADGDLTGTPITIDVQLGSRTSSRQTDRRATVTVLVAAAAVLVTVVAAATLLRRDDGSTTVTDDVPDATVAPASDGDAPVTPSGEPHIVYTNDDGTLTGTGWTPGAEVTATQGALGGTAVVDGEGSFVIANVFGHCCTFGEPLVVTDGEHTIETTRVFIELVRVDPANDIVAGRVNEIASGGTMTLDVIGGDRHHSTTVEYADIDWSVDLSDEFDLLTGMIVTATIEFRDLSTSVSSGTRIEPYLHVKVGEETELDGFGWLPDTRLTATVGGRQIDGGGVVTGINGGFAVVLDHFGLDAPPGTVIDVTDGLSTVEFAVPVFEYDSFDPEGAAASGRSDLPNGTSIQVELWLGTGGSQATTRIVADATIEGGRWQADFEPIPPELTPIETNITYGSDASWSYDRTFIAD